MLPQFTHIHPDDHISIFLCLYRLEDFDGEEVDEEALIEQRRQQRLAIVQVR